MCFEKDLMKYVKDEEQEKSVEILKLLSPAFVPLLLNFIHDTSVKLVDLKKNRNTLSPKLKKVEDLNIIKPCEKVKTKKNFTTSKPNSGFSSANAKSVAFQSHETKNNNNQHLYNILNTEIKKSKIKGKQKQKRSLFKESSSSTDQRCNNKEVLDLRLVNSQTQISTISVSSNSFNLNSSDDFPTLSADKTSSSIIPLTVKSSKNVRRIKPTLVTVNSYPEKSKFLNSGTKVQNNGNSDPTTCDETILKGGREELLKCRIFSLDKSSNANPGTEKVDNLASPPPFEMNSSVEHSTETNVLSASTQAILMRLSEVYACCIEKYLVPSVIQELHILITLLLLDDDCVIDSTTGSTFDSITSLLNSGSNARVFAAFTLEKLCTKGFLSVFSDETLSLLVSNINGDSKLEPLLEQLSSQLQNSSIHYTRKNSSSTSIHNAVPFKADTDDRSNFSNDKAFHGFRKQRDMFYALLRHWKNAQMSNEKISREAIGQLRWLVTQVKSLSTFNAFLRLFVDQLLLVGMATTTTTTDHSTQRSFGPALPSLLKEDSEKLRRLENRVSNPSSSQRMTSSSWMQREFQFFKDFVTLADSHILSVRLCDILQTRISELESENSLVDESGSNDSLESKENLSQAIHNLRICGNFYGFVVFLPYNDAECASFNGGSHMERAAGEFLRSSLERSLRDGHLLLTVPWVVQFLSFVGASHLCSPLYSGIFKTLWEIYRLPVTFTSFSSNSTFKLVIAALVGYLFEQDFFNEDTFYSYFDDPSERKYEAVANSVDASSGRILTNDLIYECHWRFGEIRNLLKYKSTSITKRQLPKKIKPSTEKLPESSRLQTKLEASFFRNQPLSLKRTVTFVAERCHSNCVKHLCSNVLSGFWEENNIMSRFSQEELSSLNATTSLRCLAKQVFVEVKTYLKAQAVDFIRENTTRCMEVLVSPILPKPILKTATEIAERMSLESLDSWLNDRLLDHIVTKLKMSLSAKPQQDYDVTPKDQDSVSGLLHSLREFIIESQHSTGDQGLAESVSVQLSTVCTTIYSPPSCPSTTFLPNHILAVVCYLVLELLTLINPSASTEPAAVLESLEMLKDNHKEALVQLLLCHQ